MDSWTDLQRGGKAVTSLEAGGGTRSLSPMLVGMYVNGSVEALLTCPLTSRTNTSLFLLVLTRPAMSLKQIGRK